MADERSRPPYSQPSPVPADYAWPALLDRDGNALFDHYRHTLEALGNERGTLGPIFGKAQNKYRFLGSQRRCSVRGEERKGAVIEERQLGGGRVLQSDSRLSGICVG